MTDIDTQEPISNHDLHPRTHRVPHNLVPIHPKIPQHILDPRPIRRRLIQQLQHIDQTSRFLRNKLQRIQRPLDTRVVVAPGGVPCPLSGVVEAVLRAGSTVEVNDGVEVVFVCEIQCGEEVRPCTRDVG